MIIATIAVATALAQAIHSNRSLNFFELRVDELPKLQLDKREVIEAPLTSPVELQSMALTGLLASYLALRQPSDGSGVARSLTGHLRRGRHLSRPQ
jgi:hypothetical protein